MKLKDACSLEGKLWQTSCIKKQRHHSANIGSYSQSHGFSSSYVHMWELVHKENWVPKNWCFWTVLLEKTFEGPLESKEIKPVNPKGNQPWILEGLMLKLKLRYLGHTLGRTNSLEKTQMLGKHQAKEKGLTGWLDSITESVDMNLSNVWENVEDRESQHAIVHGIAKSWTWLSNW